MNTVAVLLALAGVAATASADIIVVAEADNPNKVPPRPADHEYNNPRWLPGHAPVKDQRWRLMIYAMENDPDALLKRVGEDFPNSKHLGKAEQVPSGREEAQ